jgi:hypothetical protein
MLFEKGTSKLNSMMLQKQPFPRRRVNGNPNNVCDIGGIQLENYRRLRQSHILLGFHYRERSIQRP